VAFKRNLWNRFLKSAVLASYLETKMVDIELIDALKCHFDLPVQRIATAQLNC
jgi:hypothetical protein